MTLNTYIEYLQKLLEKYGDLPIVYSMDEEGNGFNPVNFEPVGGKFEYGEFTPVEEFTESTPITHVCIN